MADSLEEMRAAWEAVARYRVIVKEPRKPDDVRDVGLTWQQAQARSAEIERELAARPGYRMVMSRPMATIELENEAEARAAYQANRHKGD